MNKIKQFTQYAVEGGWKKNFLVTLPKDAYNKKTNSIILRFEECEGGGWTSKWKEIISIEQMLLDPLAWQAVGKIMEWGLDEDGNWNEDVWQNMWFHFIGSLADGLSIEEALKKII